MIYSATYLSPNGTAINALIDNTFSWQPNTTNGDTQVAYELYIYRNDTNALVYDSNKIISSLNSHTVPSSSLSNTSSYAYKWKIRTWKDNTNFVDSDFVIVKCNSPQTISFTVPSTINLQNYNFTATYSQSESIKLKYYRFLLYDNASTPNLIEDTGLVYSSTPTISYNLSGLVNNQDYNIKLQTISQNDIQVDTMLKAFNVSYTYPPTTATVEVVADNTVAGIKLSWENIKIVNGIVVGSYSYVTGKFNQGINVTANSYLYYDEKFGEEFTISFWVKLDSNFVGKIVELYYTDDTNKNMIIGFDGQRFYYQQDYRITAGAVHILPAVYFLIGIKNSKIIIKTNTFTEIIV